MYVNILYLGSKITLSFVSTYVVCERLSVMHWACWSGWNFGPNSTVYPYSVEYPPPPPPRKWKLSESPSPSTEYPPPLKMKIVRESKSEYPPPKMKNCQRVQVWVQNTPPKMKIVRESKSEYRIPPPNWNLGLSWHFKTFQFSVTEYHPPPKKLKFRHILAL